MSKAIKDADHILHHATPILNQTARETQPFGHVVRIPIALSESVCKEAVTNLNQLLADTMTLRDLYKKTPLAAVGSNVRPVAPAVRQALRGAKQTDRRARRTHPASWSD